MGPYSGIVLAGGESRRMGRDKATLALGGETLLQRAVRAVGAVVDDILIVGPERHISLRYPATFVADDHPGTGPLGGLLTGLRRVRHDAALAVACDMPFLDTDVLHTLLDLAEGFDAVIPLAGGYKHPLHAVYRRTIVPAVERHLAAGYLKVDLMLDELNVRWVQEDEVAAIDPHLQSVLNVNTEAEWHRTERHYVVSRP